ncbi:peptidoglycan DD-metalloendopeptidase family protein [Mammaliicoccus fleurettii]|uniref:lysostaphin n=1 Tax=Mammaliicoccus fleurettii TaxID=150056 RepID=A0ABS5MK22_9STAP|nr:peptidoglycan DD-metalloendopeptidase family protein [Mammaliicoccus fleurettii]MBL0846524.1 peptidoglycan DD-metalloendopeptidase family protein [Mammaliicoccus fleurettii]MBS3670965.1 peptidoglycan DD-metalloendopeptidase family protein [Mammaliicoccus fleurettii]MBS3696024.1 peptidoglycan DD-metalloendopeptidase family protein [Mammaliicoccus fleurettii]
MAEFNLGAEVYMDVDPIKASKTTLENHLKGINKSLKSQRNEFKKNEMSIEDLADREKKLGMAYKSQEELLKRKKDELNKLQVAMKSSNKVTDEQKIKVNNASAAVRKAEIGLNKYNQEIKEVQSSQKLFGRTTDEVKNSLGQMRNQAKMSEIAFKQSGKSVNDYKGHLKSLDHGLTKHRANIKLLEDNLKEVSAAQGSGSRAADKLRNDIAKESIAFQILQGRIDETTDELKALERQQLKMVVAGNLMRDSWEGARNAMDRMATTLRSIGEIGQGVIGGTLMMNFSALVPILGSVISLTAGLAGMMTALAGGAIGLGGAYAIALGGIMAFSGQATYALKMLEDGTLRVTGEVNNYKSALSGLKSEWEGLIAQNQAAIFNTMSNGINIARTSLINLNPFLTKTAGLIEKTSGKINDWVTNSTNAKSAFKLLNTTGVTVFGNLLSAGVKSLDGITHLLVQFGPLFDWVGAGVDNMASKFKKWANSTGTDNNVKNFIEYTKTNLPIVGSIFGNIFGGIVNLFRAFSGHSHNVMVGIQGVTQSFKEWTAEIAKSQGFKDFISYLETNGPKVWQLIKNITQSLWHLAVGMSPIGAKVLEIAVATTGWVNSMLKAHPTIGKTIALLTAFAGAALLVGKPIIIAVGAINGLMGAMGKIAPKTAEAGKSAGILSRVFAGLRTVLVNVGRFMLGPWGLAIMALVGGLVLAYKKSETFRNIVNGAFTSVKNGVISFVNIVKPLVMNAINALVSFGTQLGNQLKAFWQQNGSTIMQAVRNIGSVVKFVLQTTLTVVKGVFNAIYSVIKFIMPVVKTIIQNAWTGIKQIITGALNVILGAVKVFAGLFSGNFRVMWSGIKQIFKGAIGIVVGVVRTSFIGMIVSLIVKFASNIKRLVSNLWTGVKSIFIKMITGIYNWTRTKFNQLNTTVRNIFNNMSKFLRSIWTTIKNFIVKTVQNIWTQVKNKFNGLYKSVRSIFTNLSKFSRALWLTLKNYVTKIAQTLWTNVRNKFNGLLKSTRSIFNNLSKFARSLWTTLKNSITKTAQTLWTNVKNKFSGMWKSVKGLLTKLRNFSRDTWNGIKNKTTSLINTTKNNVVNGFKKMWEGGKKWINKIGDYITGAKDSFKKKAKSLGISAANGAISGLNKMIGGINKISNAITDKNLLKEIPTLSTGTGNGAVSTNSQGQLTSPTTAIVNDKGPGNGTGINGHQEIIQRRDGSMYAPQGRNVMLGLGKGDSVISGKDTQRMQRMGMIPRFSTGTIPRFAKGSKKKNWLGNLASSTGDVAGKFGADVTKTAHSAVDTGKKTVKAGVSAAKSGASYLGDKIGDVWDYVKNPGKLVEKMLGGISFGGKNANATMRMAGFAFNKMKKSLVGTVKSWFEEAEGGDGDAAWLLKHDIWQKFGNYTGGLGFNGGKHYGVDFGMTPGTSVKAVSGGKVSRVWDDYGGGKSVEVDIGKGLTNWYLHLSKQLVKKGQRVSVGDEIAKSGNTGAYTAGSGHLHFQLNKGGKPQSNVLEWLKGLGGGGSKSGMKWASQIKKALSMNGLPTSPQYVKAWAKQIDSESGGNPKAVQGGYVDVNTGGNEAKGLVQVAKGTFNQYKRKGHGNVFNPLDNLLAGIAYAKSRYGSGGMLSVIGKGHGYAKGTNNARRGFNQVFEEGGEIMQMRGGETVIPNDVSIQAFKQIATSDIFQKTQSAVYDGISRYASELRNDKQEQAVSQQQAILKQQQETQDLKEQNSILKEMLYTMQGLLQSSKNNETYNKATSEKDMSLNGRLLNKNNNEQQAINMATSLMGR